MNCKKMRSKQIFSLESTEYIYILSRPVEPHSVAEADSSTLVPFRGCLLRGTR